MATVRLLTNCGERCGSIKLFSASQSVQGIKIEPICGLIAGVKSKNRSAAAEPRSQSRRTLSKWNICSAGGRTGENRYAAERMREEKTQFVLVNFMCRADVMQRSSSLVDKSFRFVISTLSGRLRLQMLALACSLRNKMHRARGRVSAALVSPEREREPSAESVSAY